MKKIVRKIDFSVISGVTTLDLEGLSFKLATGITAVKMLADRHNPYLPQAFKLYELAEEMRLVMVELEEEAEKRQIQLLN